MAVGGGMIIVTGGAGFIGSNLVAALEERGEGPLVVCDRPGAGGNGRTIAKRRLDAVIEPAALPAWLTDHAGAVRAVFHLGATSSTTETDASLLARNNYRFSMDLWLWCAAGDVPLIYASSAATYGDGSCGFDDDGSIPALARLKPLNGYGRSKHLVDRRIAHTLAAGGARPPQWAGLKFFNVYGPNEYHKGGQRSVVASVYADAAAGRPVRLFKSCDPRYADGGQCRDFVWVGDCVAVMLWAAGQPAGERPLQRRHRHGADVLRPRACALRCARASSADRVRGDARVDACALPEFHGGADGATPARGLRCALHDDRGRRGHVTCATT